MKIKMKSKIEKTLSPPFVNLTLEWSRAVWKDLESRDEVTSRNMVPRGVHIVHAWTTEIKE